MNYYDLLWNKFKGIDDAQILSYLPKNLKQDVSHEILKKFFDSDVFTKGEKGVKISIIKRLKIITVPRDEVIVKRGELGVEMYFILEGQVEVEWWSDEIGIVKSVSFAQVKYFGEMSIMDEASRIKNATL